jgi:hypothetical protein
LQPVFALSLVMISQLGERSAQVAFPKGGPEPPASAADGSVHLSEQFCCKQGIKSFAMHDWQSLSGVQSALQGSDASFTHATRALHAPLFRSEP